jgi:hypothetical protein
MSRDYAADMRAVIDAETAAGPYVSAVVAEHIVDKLRATDPDLLNGWLDSQAAQLLRHAINLRDCSVRSHNRATQGRSVFRDAAEAAAAGDIEPLRSHFLAEVYVVEDGSRIRLADMRKPELLYAADTFQARARRNQMQEAFLRALAAKVGKGRVADRFDEDKVAALWRSLTGGD